MQSYDVVIVGAGPAGMWCAEKLSDSSLSILLLEKNNEPGHKICAGGITRKGIEMLDIPDEIIEQKVNSFALHSRNFEHAKVWPESITITVNRLVFGKWQLERLKNTQEFNTATMQKLQRLNRIVLLLMMMKRLSTNTL